LATNASRHAREHFHVHIVLRKLESLYEDLAIRYASAAKR
jgi:hypothetical protein